MPGSSNLCNLSVSHTHRETEREVYVPLKITPSKWGCLFPLQHLEIVHSPLHFAEQILLWCSRKGCDPSSLLRVVAPVAVLWWFFNSLSSSAVIFSPAKDVECGEANDRTLVNIWRGFADQGSSSSSSLFHSAEEMQAWSSLSDRHGAKS